jgi:general transcription factor 3C polypeptide 5 (transcription factor C subunit 1)
MFEVRPIWTSLAIYDYLTLHRESRGNILDINEASGSLFHSLVCVAYHIKTGPFKVCWVRYGINPLLSSEYRLYQVVVLSLREWTYAEELSKLISRTNNRYISKKVGSTPIGISKGEVLPDRLFFGLQLVDLDHPLLSEILQESQSQYSFHSGWFTSNQLTAVRDFIMLKYQRLIITPQNSKLGKSIMLDITSVDQLKRELQSIRPKKVAADQFDFELLNDAQQILGIYDSPENETIPELLDVITKKFTAFTLDRVHSY